MPQTFFQDFRTDNDEPVTVEYGYGPGGEYAMILEAWREPDMPGDVAIDIKLSDKENDRMCDWIMEHRHWSDHADAGDC